MPNPERVCRSCEFYSASLEYAEDGLCFGLPPQAFPLNPQPEPPMFAWARPDVRAADRACSLYQKGDVDRRLDNL